MDACKKTENFYFYFTYLEYIKNIHSLKYCIRGCKLQCRVNLIVVNVRAESISELRMQVWTQSP